jgi:hypothetical protein
MYEVDPEEGDSFGPSLKWGGRVHRKAAVKLHNSFRTWYGARVASLRCYPPPRQFDVKQGRLGAKGKESILARKR